MIKLRHSEYYILLAIAISVLSLTLSIVSLRQKVGRYQFLEAGAHIHILDTTTGRIFTRNLVDIIRSGKGKNIWMDSGPVNKPLNPHTEEQIEMQSRWEDDPVVSESPTWEEVKQDLIKRNLLSGTSENKSVWEIAATELANKGSIPPPKSSWEEVEKVKALKGIEPSR